MKDFKLLIASLVLTCLAMFPAASLADEDLNVTMDVIENLSDVDGVILEVSTEADEVDGDHYDEEAGDYDGDEGDGDNNDEEAGDYDGEEDGFEHNDEAGYDEHGMYEEDGHDEGDDVDTDEPVDEEPDGMDGDGAGVDVPSSEG